MDLGRWFMLLWGRMGRIGRDSICLTVSLISTPSRFFMELTWFRVSAFVQSEEGKETGKRLWDEALEILRKVAPEVDKVF
jgi:hypothetical protein